LLLAILENTPIQGHQALGGRKPTDQGNSACSPDNVEKCLGLHHRPTREPITFMPINPSM
jgi:hypothetical protein